MQRKIILSGALWFLYCTIDAQYTPTILPPSPNATSIAKFVESPVSYYRGSANVNIPLININTGDIPLNVSIQYDTKGIRVGEVASSVGAGWSLIAGGLITRQVRQRPDEYPRGYLTYSYNSTFETNAALRQQLYNENAGYSSSDTPVDEDPDLFFVNFLGRSAKFIIDNVTKKAVVQGFDDWTIDIEYENPNIQNFEINRIIITDEIGNTYYFGKDFSGTNSAYDIVTGVSSGLITDQPTDQESEYKTAWHLKEIRTPKNSCTLNYISERVTTYSKTDLKGGGNSIVPISRTITITRQQMLQNISFPEGTLELTYSIAEREDLRGGKALNNIVLKDKSGAQINKMVFAQSYRLGNGDYTNIHPAVRIQDTKSDKRLFLNQINEISRDGNITSSYKLEYDPTELPNRHSNSIDHWGYYNGKPNNMYIFATVSDRNVYADYAQAGILTKITYPAGGTENFYYENNNVTIPNYLLNYLYPTPTTVNFVGGGRRISRIETNDNGIITKRKFTYTLDNGTTSGKLLGIPDYMSVVGKFGNIPLVAGQISNRIQPMSSFNNAGQVGYSQVTESFLSANDSVLWTKKYNFSNYLDGGEYYRFPYHLSDDMDWARGLNLKTISYDSTGKTVEVLENLYHFSGEELAPYRFYKTWDDQVVTNTPKYGLIPDLPPAQAPPSYLFSHYIKSIPIYKFGTYLNGPFNPSNLSPNVYRTAFFYGGMIQNYQKIKTEYINGIASKVIYIDTTNGSLNHHQVTSQKTTYPDKIVNEINYSYAHEKGNQLMTDKNMIGIPLETIYTQIIGTSTKTLSKTETVYPKTTAEIINNSANLILPLSIKSYDISNLGNPPSTEVTYNIYDGKGNLQQYTKKEGIPVSIIWGYNRTQPIAKIEGAKLSDISQSLIDNIINASEIDAQMSTDVSEQTLVEALDSFRNNSELSGYQISTYSYNPLIGVTSVTPPSGIREVYFYDSANRLQKVIDVQGKTLKEFKYNYKN